jgi:hypothetical protein
LFIGLYATAHADIGTAMSNPTSARCLLGIFNGFPP